MGGKVCVSLGLAFEKEIVGEADVRFYGQKECEENPGVSLSANQFSVFIENKFISFINNKFHLISFDFSLFSENFARFFGAQCQSLR